MALRTFFSTLSPISSHSRSLRERLFFLALRQDPPRAIMAPMRNPKSYDTPALFVSYIRTVSLNRLMMKVITRIRPCQSPAQNPASSVAKAAVPAAHPAPAKISTRRKRATVFLVTSFMIAPWVAEPRSTGSSSVSPVEPTPRPASYSSQPGGLERPPGPVPYTVTTFSAFIRIATISDRRPHRGEHRTPPSRATPR